MTFIKGLCAL